MRISGPCRSPHTPVERLASDSGKVVARHVKQRAEVGRARGRRRLTARHGRGVRALAMRALPGDGRVQRGAAGAAQPAAARAVAGSLLSVTAPGAPVCGSRAREAAALRAAGGSRAGGAVRTAASSACAPAAAGLLLVGMSTAATGAEEMLWTRLPRRHRWLSASNSLCGVRRGRGGAPPRLHSATATAARAAAALRASGTPVLCTSSQKAAASA